MNRQNGAHFRVASLLTFLVSRGCQVTMYSFANHPECSWNEAGINLFKEQFPTVPLVLDRRSPFLVYWTKFKKMFAGIFPASAPRLLKLRLPCLTPNYDKLRQSLPDALYVINYANGMLELNGVDPDVCMVETHDLDFLQFSKRFGHAITSLKIISKFRSEIALLESAMSILSIAKTETGLFRLLFPNKPVFFLPNYGEPAHRLRLSESNFEYDMLFVGSRNQFNVDGIVSFLANQSRLLQQFSLAIAGEVSTNPKVIDACCSAKRVRLLGFVNDLGALYDRAKIVISPVDGTGLKIKVIEALAAGKPVFGSRHSLEGLPSGSEQCAFLIDAEQIRSMLLDPTRLKSASEAALTYSQTLASSGDLVEFQSFLRKAAVSD
jgi:hypothetical protein